MIIYLLHFERAVRGKRHYLGSTEDHQLARRMRAHQNGEGANLTHEVARQRVPFTLARVWHSEDRTLERVLKKRSHFAAVCPMCSTLVHIAPGDAPGVEYHTKINPTVSSIYDWPASPMRPQGQ